MSEQILLQGKILGTGEFLVAGHAEGRSARSAGEDLLAGRSQWITLLSEVLPRALLAELGLARILLGSSGGSQFLVVLPGEARSAAENFLTLAARQVSELSGGFVKLIWAVTDNLGDWAVIRRRLNDELQAKRNAPLAALGAEAFRPFANSRYVEADAYFAKELGAKVRETSSLGWSPENPGKIVAGAGKHTWNITANLSGDGILLARHAAPSDDSKTIAPVQTLARRAQGRSIWGVLRGDVDNFGLRLRRVHSIEEHVPLSVLYKQFFAGELEVLCSMPEFWRKVTVVYSGGDDFAVYGAWDALIGLAREMERLFRRFTEANLADFTGPEGKTITMALALAPAEDASLGSVFEEAGRRLEAAKSSDKDCIYLLGRTLEWKQFTDAADLKDLLLRMVTDFGVSSQYLKDLCGIYRETQSKMSKRQARKMGGERPWRYHRRIRRILSAARPAMGPARGDYQKARTALIADLIGRSAVTVKLRPAGRVALEWARLSAEA